MGRLRKGNQQKQTAPKHNQHSEVPRHKSNDLDNAKYLKKSYISQDVTESDPALAKEVESFLHDYPSGTKKSSQNSSRRKSLQHQSLAADSVPKPGPRGSLLSSTLPKTIPVNSKTKFVLPPSAKWYAIVPALDSSKQSTSTPTALELTSLISRASTLHDADVATFQSSSSSSSEASFLSNIVQSGTLSDRLSALTLSVQSSPLHNTKALDMLKSMAERGKGKGGREESLKALRCIVDWWVGGGVPDRKLRYIRDQPLSHPGVKDEHILVWYFEDWLKKYFFSVLQILEALSLDPLSYVRTQALNLISILLREKPEQEHNLLRLLVNKLGDTEKPICARASYHLLQLLQAHPSMKSVIVREISNIALRSTASTRNSDTPKATKFANDGLPRRPKPSTAGKVSTQDSHVKYYATITLNQTVITPVDKEVARKLIDFYFEVFKDALGDRDGFGDESIQPSGKELGKVDKRGRVSDGKRANVGAKTKEVKGAAGFKETEDNSFKLVSAILTGVNRALPFAKIDSGDEKLSKHIDTLFLITHKSTFNISLQSLVLIQHITASLSSTTTSQREPSSISSSIVDRYYRTLYSSLFDPRLATSSKQAMYLNLLFKSIKADENRDRANALIRRFVQVMIQSGPNEFVAGGLYLLGELFGTIPGLREVLNQVVRGEPKVGGKYLYDPLKRDPQFAHSSQSPLWELVPLAQHYHPSLSLHAHQLLSSQPVTGSADLSLNTLSHFLDRFVYKNPKKTAVPEKNARGASAMQPAASGHVSGVRIIKGQNLDAAVNEEKFMKKEESDVPVDQLFYYKYFSRRNVKENTLEKKKKPQTQEDDQVGHASGDDTDGESSNVQESDIWEAIKKSIPEAISEEDDAMPSSAASSTDQDISNDDEDEESVSLAEASDDEDLLSLDCIDSHELDNDGNDEGEWGGITRLGQKRKAIHVEGNRKRKKTLPTFASYDDYATLIEGGLEDDI